MPRNDKSAKTRFVCKSTGTKSGDGQIFRRVRPYFNNEKLLLYSSPVTTNSGRRAVVTVVRVDGAREKSGSFSAVET